jgi:branched-subunit amino acid aminotransferase/4-amino-4-deoxychorismate lyase
MLILFENQFIKETEARISVTSKSVMYGFGLFETMKAENGKIKNLEKHLQRLTKAAETIGINFNFAQLKTDSEKIAKKATEKWPDKTLKVKILALEAGVYFLADILEIDSKIYDGVKLKSVQINRGLPEVKSTSYLSAYHAHSLAVNEGAYDAVLVDQNGFITEGAYSNIFWFDQNGQLCTTKDDVLPGITRQIILENSEVKFEKITLKELQKQPEVFLTQSTKGIVPVTEIDRTKLSNTAKTQDLRRALRI